MRTQNKTLALLLVILFMSLQFNVIAKSEEPEEPLYGGTLIIASPADVTTFNAPITWSIASHYVSGQIYNSLLMYDFELNPIPDLAKSWEISEDGLTYTFHLHEGVKWHDGVAFTSEDVKFTFEEAVIPYHPLGATIHGALIESIGTPDINTVVFKLKNAYPPFIKFFGLLWAGIIPKHLYEGTDMLSNPHNMDNPVGTGPFKFVEWVKGDHITLVRNDDYFKEGKPYLDKIIFKIIPSSAARMLALEIGEVDYDLSVPIVDAERLGKIEGINVVEVPTGFASPDLFSINIRNAPLNDKTVRQALYYAMDKEFILEKVYLGVAFDCYGAISDNPVMTEFVNPNLNKYEYDPEKAEQLLDDAGYPRQSDGTRFSISVIYRAGLAQLEQIAEITRSYWNDVGVNLELTPMEEVSSLEAVYTRFDFDLYLRWASAGPDPSMLKGYFHSSMIGAGHFTNCFGLENSRIDELFALAEKETDTSKRVDYFSEMQEILNDELPALWLYDAPAMQAFDDDFVGIPVGPWGAARERQDIVWWKNGFSPANIEDAKEAIDKAEDEGRNIGLDEAISLYEQSQASFDSGNFDEAARLAASAVLAANDAQTYWEANSMTIISAVIIVLIIAVVAFYYLRKRS